MLTAAARERLDHATLLPNSAAFACALFVAATIGGLSWQSAAAQGAQPCTGIEDDSERLACYDRALRGPVPEPAAQERAAPAAAREITSTATATEPRSERNIRESAAPVAPAAPVAGAVEDDDDDGIIPIVIIGTRGLPGRETIFTAKDGATWVQTDSKRTAGLPEPPFEAELKPGTFGSYFLVPKDGRAIRVRAGDR